MRSTVGGLVLATVLLGGASAASADAYTSTPPVTGPPATTPAPPEVQGASVTPSPSPVAPARSQTESPRGSLPVTGGDVAGLLAIGGAAVAGGAALVVAGRRRGQVA